MNDAMQAQQRLIKAMQNYQMGDLKNAEKELVDLQRKFPRSDQIQSMLGAIYFAQKKHKDSFRAYREALKINPNNEDAAIGIASAENSRGNTANAIKLLVEACRKFPRRADALFNLGTIYLEKEDLKKAEGVFQSAVKVEPRLIQAHLQLVNIYKSWNKLDLVEYHLKAAIAINPAPELQQKLEEVRELRGADAQQVAYEAPVVEASKDEEEPEGSLISALGIDEKNPQALLNAAQTFMDKNQLAEAEECLEKALELEPDNEKARLGMRKIRSTRIPMWHFEMLADTTRNNAYQQAIEKALKEAPGMRVLDIGTGSGLLAMMAARAGASEVLACEMNADLAKAATQIVSDNGYSDVIKVVNKKSSDVRSGEDFNEKYDLVVSEILDVGGLGEGVIPSLRDARNRLLTKGAVTIPSGITMYAQLIEAPDMYSVNPVKQISGFDLSSFDQFRPVVKYFQTWMEKENYTELCDPVAFREFDFYNIPDFGDQQDPHTEDLLLRAKASATAHAVVYWFDLHLDDEIKLSSGLGGELKHWGQAICYLNKPLSVQEGNNVKLQLKIADDLIWFES